MIIKLQHLRISPYVHEHVKPITAVLIPKHYLERMLECSFSCTCTSSKSSSITNKKWKHKGLGMCMPSSSLLTEVHISLTWVQANCSVALFTTVYQQLHSLELTLTSRSATVVSAWDLY